MAARSAWRSSAGPPHEAPEHLRAGLTPGGLLDLTVELREDSPPVPVAPTLLAELLPVRRLGPYAVLAAAHDEESARMLAHARLQGESLDGDVALRVRDQLRSEDWAASEPGSGHFVADPLLRALLLHRLRFEDGDHPGTPPGTPSTRPCTGTTGPGPARTGSITTWRSAAPTTPSRICGRPSPSRTSSAGWDGCGSSAPPPAPGSGTGRAPTRAGRSPWARGHPETCRRASTATPSNSTCPSGGCCTPYGC